MGAASGPRSAVLSSAGFWPCGLPFCSEEPFLKIEFSTFCASSRFPLRPAVPRVDSAVRLPGKNESHLSRQANGESSGLDLESERSAPHSSPLFLCVSSALPLSEASPRLELTGSKRFGSLFLSSRVRVRGPNFGVFALAYPRAQFCSPFRLSPFHFISLLSSLTPCGPRRCWGAQSETFGLLCLFRSTCPTLPSHLGWTSARPSLTPTHRSA